MLEGLPGLAKTKLVETLGIVLGLSEQRIQFTPDLMPTDITGTDIIDSIGKTRRYVAHVIPAFNPVIHSICKSRRNID